MIIGFIGGRNSGKTCSMSIEAFKKFKQGYKIYSNYHLNFPYTPYTVDDLMSFAESGIYFGNAIFLLDEIHIWFDARCSGKKRNIIFSYFLNQSSKNDIDIFYTSQFSRQVEIRMRLNTEIVTESNCRVFIKAPGKNWEMRENYRPKPKEIETCKIKTYITNLITKFSETGLDKIVKRVYKANKYFPLYNTREVIKQQSDVFQRAKEDDKRNKGIVKAEKIPAKQLKEEAHLNRLWHEQNRAKYLVNT